jgi:hypothetical protein
MWAFAQSANRFPSIHQYRSGAPSFAVSPQSVMYAAQPAVSLTSPSRPLQLAVPQGAIMPRRIFLFFALTATSLFAQTTEPTVHTAADLRQREAQLIETANASPSGMAIGRLEDYGNDYTLLVVRVHTGEAERHQFFADQIVIKDGTIILITGGTMQGEHPNNGPSHPGETLGSSIDGGKEVVLHTGDIVHIPAGIPHWVKVAPGTTTTYLIFKEK